MSYADFLTLIKENTSNKLDDYNKLCRFCLKSQSNGIDISDGNHNWKQQRDAIHNNYFIITKQYLLTTDEYPNFVCSPCEDTLGQYAHFAQQIEQNADNWEIFLKGCTDVKVPTEERIETNAFLGYDDINPMPVTAIKVEYCDDNFGNVQDTNTYDALDPSLIKIEVKNEILNDITPTAKRKKKTSNKPKLPAFMKLSTEFERTCKYCDEQTFSSLAHLYTHTKQNHPGEKVFSCDICGAQFISKQALSTHMTDRHAKCGKKHQCQYCAKLFFSDRELKGHEKYHLNSRSYVCTLCGKSFNQKTSLNVHMKSKAHNADYQTNKTRKSYKNSKKVFRCQQCVPATVYASSEERADHRNAMHKIHECGVCKNSFLTQESLDSHKFLHSAKPRPLVCSVCNATFNQSSHLSSHFKRRHTNNKSFHCPHCDKSFFENCELNAHIRLVHRKDRKYLQKHIQDRHSTAASPYDCKICGKKNGSGANLDLHRLKHHKEIH